MSKHRTVDVYQYVLDSASGKYKKEYSSSGVFHQFGMDAIEHYEGNTHYSVAIVELAGGEIIMPSADMIVFTSSIECDVDDAIAKKIATEFYLYWHNAPGTNTYQGFDDWWKSNRQRILSKGQS